MTAEQKEVYAPAAKSEKTAHYHLWNPFDTFLVGTFAGLVGLGIGQFLMPKPLHSTKPQVYSSDVNKDGKTDIILHYTPHYSEIYLGQEDGTYKSFEEWKEEQSKESLNSLDAKINVILAETEKVIPKGN